MPGSPTQVGPSSHTRDSTRERSGLNMDLSAGCAGGAEPSQADEPGIARRRIAMSDAATRRGRPIELDDPSEVLGSLSSLPRAAGHARNGHPGGGALAAPARAEHAGRTRRREVRSIPETGDPSEARKSL